jgi:hypothetical protein
LVVENYLVVAKGERKKMKIYDVLNFFLRHEKLGAGRRQEMCLDVLFPKTARSNLSARESENEKFRKDKRRRNLITLTQLPKQNGSERNVCVCVFKRIAAHLPASIQIQCARLRNEQEKKEKESHVSDFSVENCVFRYFY